MQKVSLILITFLLVGCVTKKACTRKYPTKDSVYISTYYHDTILQGATVYDTLNITKWNSIPVYSTRIIRDTNGLTELRWFKDQYGNLVASCEARDRVLEMVRTLKSKSSTQTVEVKYTPNWVWFVFGLLCTVIAFLFLKRKF